MLEEEMSEWRIIWKKAFFANELLIKNKMKGEKEFKKILKKYKTDGMVFYERGEAYEFIGDYTNAINDYQKASSLFPAPHWQRIAKLGINRNLKKQSGKKYIHTDSQWSIFHRIHCLNNLDNLTKFDALVAITLLDSEPHETALLLRCCLESLVLSLLPDLPDSKEDECLQELIFKLQNYYRNNYKPIDDFTYSMMDKVRDIGNKAAHPRKRLTSIDFANSAKAFIVAAEWADEALGIVGNK
jgi:hypothetical protein